MTRIQNNPNKKSETSTLYSSTKGRMQKILNWKFKTTFAIRRPTPPPPPTAQISRHFFTPHLSFFTTSYGLKLTSTYTHFIR